MVRGARLRRTLKHLKIVMLMLSACLAAMAWSHGNAQKLISFDAPNAGTGSGQGTSVYGINLDGTITGSVTDSGYGTHGFAGTLKGGFTDFDAPGADPVVGCTCPGAINLFGEIAGISIDTNQVRHGFVRARDGKITVFDAPGAYMAGGSGTFVLGMNNLSAVVGYYFDSNFTAHGFLRAGDGKITTFDDPAGGNGSYQGTWPYSINDFGAIVGATTYSDNTSHGLLRTFDGSYRDFDFPSATYYNTAAINDFGVIAGSYSKVFVGSQPYDFVGYQRTPDGKITTYAPSGSGTTTNYSYDGTWTNAVNIFGETAGYIADDQAEVHGFVREADGKITVFSLPAQVAVPGSFAGSAAFAINAEGIVAGFWFDDSFVAHGFVRLPR